MILLVSLPSTIVTSLNTTFSPLTPSLRTLVCPLGNVLSSFLIVSKGITSVTVRSSGLFIDKLNTPSSGIILYSILGFTTPTFCFKDSFLISSSFFDCAELVFFSISILCCFEISLFSTSVFNCDGFSFFSTLVNHFSCLVETTSSTGVFIFF